DVQVVRRVEGDGAIEVIGDRERVPLGVARGEFAAAVAGAGNDAGARLAYLGGEAELGERRLQLGSSRGCDVRDDDVLPDGKSQRAAAVALGDVGETAHLRAGHAPDGQRHPAIDMPALLLRVETDVRAPSERGTR